MILMPDTKKIAAGFHRKASEYDQHIAVQKRVVLNLVRRIEIQSVLPPETILDIGSGTGSLLGKLHSTYPDAALCGVDLAHNMCLGTSAKLGGCSTVVNADAEHLPFANSKFDLVVSTSALQWVGDLSQAIHEMRRVMKPGGSMHVAFFCEGTLGELHRCYCEAVNEQVVSQSRSASRLHKFYKVEDVKNILDGMDFETFVFRTETEMDWYDDLPSLLRSIKNIGAGTVAGGSGGGLGWRGILNEASRLYREYYGENGRIPVTYNVLYLHARVAGL